MEVEIRSTKNHRTTLDLIASSGLTGTLMYVSAGNVVTVLIDGGKIRLVASIEGGTDFATVEVEGDDLSAIQQPSLHVYEDILAADRAVFTQGEIGGLTRRWSFLTSLNWCRLELGRREDEAARLAAEAA